MQGVGADRDQLTPEEAVIVYSSTSVQPYVDQSDTLTLRVENNLVASAITTIRLYVLGGDIGA